MKLWKLTLVAALVLVAVLALASCGKCEHAYDEAITTKPTCTEEGVKTFTCSLCGESYTEPVAATGHTYTDEVVAPTCTEEGYTLHTCACGDSYKDTTVEAAGHTYDEVVTAPTCAAEGYTTYTCTVCADTYTGGQTEKDPNAHTFETQIAELTAEQAAANPHAIGIEKQVCSGCGAEGEGGAAVLIFMNFDEPVDASTYEGSDAYKATLEAAGDKANDDVKAYLAYIDSQKNVGLEGIWGGTQANLIVDGKYKVTNSPMYVLNTLGLSKATPVVPTFTISFDVVVNVTGKADKQLETATQFFGMADTKKYNNRALILALDHTDRDENVADEVYTYELVAGGVANGNSIAKASTGYLITLGKEYSFKLVVDSAAKMFEIFVKEAGEAEYTSVGGYEYKPHTNSRESMFAFSLSSAGNGNLFDNFKVTTELAQ